MSILTVSNQLRRSRTSKMFKLQFWRTSYMTLPKSAKQGFCCSALRTFSLVSCHHPSRKQLDSVAVWSVSARCLSSFSTIKENNSAALDLLRQIAAEISPLVEDSGQQQSTLHRPSNKLQSNNHLRTNVGQFGRLYRKLGQMRLNAPEMCHRTTVLRYLASECGIRPAKVTSAVHLLEKAQGHSTTSIATTESMVASELPLTAYTRIQASCTATYEDIFRLLLQDHAVEGMQCLLEIREDLLRWIPCLPSSDTQQAHLLNQLKQLDRHLQHILSTWMVRGLLQMRRLTYHDTSAHILERIVRNEAVHPVSSLDDLRKRLGPGRRVFCLFHPCLPDVPLFVLYVSLQNEIPSSMEQIHGIDHENYTESPSVAAFYSISNLRPGLVGIGLAEYLIHCAVQNVQETLPSVETFCTLSPLPTFRSWLMERISSSSDPLSLSTRLPVLSKEVADFITSSPEATLKATLDRLLSLDKYPADGSDEYVSLEALQPWLMQSAAHYLAREKHRRKPLDKVARFHIGNGAILDRLHWRADTSRKGWKNSIGIMVTYHYNLSLLSQHQSAFEENSDYFIPLGPHVDQLLVSLARKL